MKLLSRLILIKDDLKAGNIDSLSSLLDEVSEVEPIEIIREQKLLLRIMDPKGRLPLAEKYKSAARRVFSHNPTQLECEVNYADFAVLVCHARDQVARCATESLNLLPRVSLLELLRIVNRLALNWYEQIYTHAWGEVLPEIDAERDKPANVAAISERALHQIAGSTNDVAFAIARALHEALRFVDADKTFTSGRALYDGVSKSFSRLVELASVWNGLEYAADQVSYGEWVVRSIRCSPAAEVEFDVTDVPLAYARIIAIRRNAVALTEGTQRLSVLRPQLEQLVPDFVSVCVAYMTRGWSRRIHTMEVRSLAAALRLRVAELEPSDDLLLAAGGVGNAIVEDYIAALSMRWFADIATFVAKHASKRHGRALDPAVASVEMIGAFLPLPDERRLRVKSAIRTMLDQRAETRHLDLLATPFIALPESHFVCVPTIDVCRWPADLRAKWLKGGDVGRRFGRLWEDFVSMTLKEFGWSILARGIKLKKNGKAITDVDVIAARNGLVLILQLKALAGQGVNSYDHWRNRKIIHKGAFQASAAIDFIRDEPLFLQSIVPKRAVADVRRVQAAVLTNLHLFNGWQVNGVPVLSRNGLMTILNGGAVRYHKPHESTVIETKKFGSTSAWDGDEFIELLLNPVDWRVAQESLKVVHHCKEIEGMRWQIPSVGKISTEPIGLKNIEN